MPADQTYTFLPRREILTFEELTRIAIIFVELGVRKIRLTGGEPLLRRELERLVAMLKAIPGLEDLALTTNGFLLKDQARTLADAGLDRVTVSVESLDQEVFGKINGLGMPIAKVLEGIDAAVDAGLGPVKINTVVMRGVNDHEIVSIARYFKERRCIVRFIEFMDVGNLNEWQAENVLDARTIMGRIGAELPMEPLRRERPSDVALRYRYLDDGVEVGAIASITEPFCGDCTRARVSSEGRLYTCLFANQGTDMKDLLRGGVTDDDLRKRIAAVWRSRADRYSELRNDRLASGQLFSEPKVEMFRIGG